MKNLGIRSKLLLSVGTLATGYLLFFGLVEWSATTTRNHLSAISDSIYPAALDIQKAQAALQTVLRDYKDAVTLEDKQALAAAEHDSQELKTLMRDAREKLAADPALEAQVSALLDRYEKVDALSTSTYATMVLSPTSATPQTQATMAQLGKEDAAIQQAFVDVDETVGTKAFQAELSDVAQSNSRQRFLALLLFASATILGVATIVVMEKQVSAPLRELAARLADGAAQVADAARQVSGSGVSLARGASYQAASLQQTSASSQEVSTMAERSAADCQTAASLVSMSQNKFNETNRSLLELVTAMDEIRISSGKVSNIIKVIDEIAFKTNILALNAAVEAARAGEAGAGFAVVAEEVRNLAQKCSQAANDSATIVEESMARSNQGKTRLDGMSISIHAVTTESEKVKALVDQINVASNEQTRGIGQIARAISDMEKVTQASAASAQESASAAEELTAQSSLLNEIVASLTLVIGGGQPVAEYSSAA